MKRLHLLPLMLAGICAACAANPQTNAPPPARPTPTIAAAAPISTSAPWATATPSIIAAPTAVGANDTSQATAASTFAYLWPAYLPDGMRVSPKESRVARDTEVGTTSDGFYVITLNGNGRKLIIGGGSTDTIPIAGETRQVQYDNAPAQLTTDGDQRQLVFVQNKAKFFVYSRGLTEQELMLVADSLVPTDVAALRTIAGGPTS